MVDVEGHIIDSLTLAKVLDLILASGADYRLLDVDIGRAGTDTSRARIEIDSGDEATLAGLVAELAVHGALPVEEGDATLVACDQDGVVPAGWAVTSNLPTRVRVGGRWMQVDEPALDGALVVSRAGTASFVRAVPPHRVTVGDLVVVGVDGVRVEAGLDRPVTTWAAGDVADRLSAIRADGGRVLVVAGSGAAGRHGRALAGLVARGAVDVVIADGAFAVADVAGGAPVLEVVNEIRRRGSLEGAVAEGDVGDGLIAACVARSVPLVLVGVVGDPGPLPGLHTDTVTALDSMRLHVPGIGLALFVGDAAVVPAAGRLLAAGVAACCVGTAPAVFAELAGRCHLEVGVAEGDHVLDELAEALAV